jgi:uncharacterized protein YoxC
VDQVRAVAEALAMAGQQADDAEDRISSAADASDAWHGTAADEFRHRIVPLPGRLRDQQEVMSRAAELLFAWAGVLSDLRSRAESYDRQARQLDDRIAAAAQLVEEWAIAASVAGTHTRPQVQATLASHERTLGRLQAELATVLDAARQLTTEHRRAADDVADQLAALLAGSPAPPPAARRSELVTGIGSVVNGLADHVRRASQAAALAPVARDTVATAVSGGPAAAELAMAHTPADPGRSWFFGGVGVPIEELVAALSTGAGEQARDEFRES